MKKGNTKQVSEEVSHPYTSSTTETWKRPEGMKFEEEGEGTYL